MEKYFLIDINTFSAQYLLGASRLPVTETAIKRGIEAARKQLSPEIPFVDWKELTGLLGKNKMGENITIILSPALKFYQAFVEREYPEAEIWVLETTD